MRRKGYSVNRRVLVFGNGFIGRRLQEAYGCSMSEIRIQTIDDIIGEIEKYKANVIINCIGYTGGENIDACDLSPHMALNANSYIPLLFAEACIRSEVKLVHISSGCIYHYDYETDIPITECRPPDFLDLYYSRTKIYAEQSLIPLVDKYGVLIARIRIPLDCIPHKRNLLTKLLTFEKVLDVPNSVTYIPDFIKALEYLIGIDASGIYNIVNHGGLRYPKLLDVYNKYIAHPYSVISSCNEIGKVRTNLLLSTRKLECAGVKVRDISNVLEECVNRYVKIEKGDI